MTEPTNDAARLRLATDVDLSLAKPGCARCHGTGRCGYKTIEDPENPGEELKVPIVCRCVTRRGGVKKDMMDEILEQVQQQLDNGTFAQTMADDIDGLPVEHQQRAIEQLEREANNKEKPAQVRMQLRAAVGLIRQREKEAAHGHA